MKNYDDYVVIVLFNQEKVLIQNQFKVGVGKKCLGFPAGFKKKTESSLNAAKRELLEETGFQAKIWQNVETFYDNTSISKAKFTIFFATEFIKIKKAVNSDKSEFPVNNKLIKISNLDKLHMPGACMALTKELFLKMLLLD